MARPGWVTIKVSGSSLPTSVSSHITIFLIYFLAIHLYAELTTFQCSAKCCTSAVIVVMIILNQFLLLTLNWLTIGCLLKTVNKPARNLPVPVSPRSNQALVRNVDNKCNGTWKVSSSRILKVILFIYWLAQNSVVGVRVRI